MLRQLLSAFEEPITRKHSDLLGQAGGSGRGSFIIFVRISDAGFSALKSIMNDTDYESAPQRLRSAFSSAVRPSFSSTAQSAL